MAKFRSNSEEEALLEMLGLPNLLFDCTVEEDTEANEGPKDLLTNAIPAASHPGFASSRVCFQTTGVCRVPVSSACIDPTTLKRITNELVHARETYPSDKTMETLPMGDKKITRMENFVCSHPVWNKICKEVIPEVVASVCYGDEGATVNEKVPWALYKEKLNFKPGGGKGFAPHLDSPSLRGGMLGWDDDGDNNDGKKTSKPETFVTVMLTIDKMDAKNGCLEIIPGVYTSSNHYPLIPPSSNNPDGGGRLGEIDVEKCPDRNLPMAWKPLYCQPGEIVIFNGWVPHRSGTNHTMFDRRAVFLTYNPAREGEYRDEYYRRMAEARR